MENFPLKEMLVDLMKEVKDIKAKQIEHTTFSKTKLESIETQAKKTNGRLLLAEENINNLQTTNKVNRAYVVGMSSIIGVVWTVINFIYK